MKQYRNWSAFGGPCNWQCAQTAVATFYETSKLKMERYHNWSAIACALQLHVEYNFQLERHRNWSANAIVPQLPVRRKSREQMQLECNYLWAVGCGLWAVRLLAA
jgi:hypothetical protein